MDSATPDNTASTPRTRGSTVANRRGDLTPQRLNLAASPASTISSITTAGAASSNRRQARAAAIERRNDIPLAELGTVPSPIAPWGNVPNVVVFDPIETDFFSGDNVMKYAAKEGFGFTSTVRHDQLPKGVPGKYWHKDKTQATSCSRH